MKITLYNNTSDNRVVNKNITKLWDYDAAIMRDTYNVRGDSVILKGGNIQLYNAATAVNNYNVNAEGELYRQTNYATSALIPFNKDLTLCISYNALSDGSAGNYISLYDANDGFLGRFSYPSKNGNYTYKTSVNTAAQFRLSVHKNYVDYTKIMINYGNKAEPLTQYGDHDLNFANYCYIDELQRYYYIKEVTAERNGLWRLDLKCDVLMTFASGIRALSGTVDRQQNKYNGYIPDGEYKQLAYSMITAKAFPNAMNSDTLILMTVG